MLKCPAHLAKQWRHFEGSSKPIIRIPIPRVEWQLRQRSTVSWPSFLRPIHSAVLSWFASASPSSRFSNFECQRTPGLVSLRTCNVDSQAFPLVLSVLSIARWCLRCQRWIVQFITTHWQMRAIVLPTRYSPNNIITKLCSIPLHTLPCETAPGGSVGDGNAVVEGKASAGSSSSFRPIRFLPVKG